jgi:hypothetical protein
MEAKKKSKKKSKWKKWRYIEQIVNNKRSHACPWLAVK